MRSRGGQWLSCAWHPTRQDNEPSRTLDLYLTHNRVKPGMTGFAQVHGYRGELDTPEKLAGRVHYDLTYVRDWSLALDLWILAVTPWKGLRTANAY